MTDIIGITYQIMVDYSISAMNEAGIIDIPPFDPGPYGAMALDNYPGRMHIIQRVTAGPMLVENTFDSPVFGVYSIGEQNSFEDAEKMAMTIDCLWRRIDRSQDLGGVWTLSISRAGGGPQAVSYDDADRYHFYCPYVIQAESGS